ncbi:Cyanamide hydratase [Alternaria gaisen]|uniref:Cyanamide hydratase n=1 Tax=Alternaria gaisen TaxID=167740 RepID=A0ACB6FD08_9PLEO|nr:Cyanamide hydratase [Alternaria gaisen]
MTIDEVQANGWTAVPVSALKIFQARGQLSPPFVIEIEDVYFPSDNPLVAEAQNFAKTRLSAETYNHSMRVFYWGMSQSGKIWQIKQWGLTTATGNMIAKQLLPEHAATLSPVTWALTCLLHDIGTADANFTATRMSFDIYSGIKAMEVLKVLGSTHDQAKAVAEAIIRHEDMGIDGTITFMGQLIQLATLYDNVGRYEDIEEFGSMIHETTRDRVNRTFPRLRWCSWFAETVRKEESNKPWCHTAHIPQFDAKMEVNTLQKAWE